MSNMTRSGNSRTNGTLNEKSSKISVFKKLSTKITLMVSCIVLVVIVVQVICGVNKSSNTLTDTYYNYAMNLAEESAISVDFATEFGEQAYGGYSMNLAQEAAVAINFSQKLLAETERNELAITDYDELLGDINISGVEGSYAYMVSPDGTMLWHPDSGKIGNPVENAAVKGIVADLEAGKNVDDGFCIYEYKGAKKLAGYSFTGDGNIVLVTADYDKLIKIDYNKLIGEIEISGVEGSYAYMVSPDGTMLYHKDESKIGNPVENDAVKGIVADLEAGKKVENGYCGYQYKGVGKVAGYAFTNDGNIVIVTADKDVLMADVNKMTFAMILYGVFCMVVAVICAVLFTTMMFKGLTMLVSVINKTAEFDLRLDERIGMLSKKTDEVGVMANSIHNMREQLRGIVTSMKDAGDQINDNVGSLQLIVDNVGDVCQENSAITEELSSGMEETSATTGSINANVNSVKQSADGIERLAEEGFNSSKEILTRANSLADNTKSASDKTKNMYESVKVKAAHAIEASKTVEKINELADSIMSISSQTSLLSLNASIEAARAGEAGRGFAVVATEISNLAVQTSETVKNITSMVQEVTESVDMMAGCLEETTSFLEKNVLSDYDEFGKVSVQYKDDANDFGYKMENIKASIHKLNEALADIMNSISEIDSTVGQSADGIADIAAKTGDMVNGATESSDMVAECKNAVENQRQLISKFLMEG